MKEGVNDEIVSNVKLTSAVFGAFWMFFFASPASTWDSKLHKWHWLWPRSE